jgi:hypothetical protein
LSDDPALPIVPPIAASRREECKMKLINTDGLAFIGPGSEWFWTALTGLVLAATFLAIYRQLSIARSASLREQLDAFARDWNSERMQRHKLEVLVAVRDGVDPAHLPEGSVDALSGFYERIGALARSGDFDAEALQSAITFPCQGWWTRLAPQVRRWRAEAGEPRIYDNFEWLAGHIAEMDRRAGHPAFDERTLGPFDERIASLRGSLRVEQALRSVIVASPDAPTAAQPAATLAAQAEAAPAAPPA